MTDATRTAVNPLHVLAHFARILLAASLLAGMLAAGPIPAEAQDTPAPTSNHEKVEAHHRTARQLIRDGKLADARDELLAALTLEPRNGDTHAYLAAVAARSERWPEALASYEKALEIGPPRSSLHYGIGVCKRALNDLPAASAALASARTLGEKELTEALATLASVEARAKATPTGPGSDGAAVPTSEEIALARAGASQATATVAEVSYQLAIVARDLGDETAESAALDRGLALAPAHPKLLTEEGAFLLRKGDVAAAVAALEKAQSSPGVDLSALYELGRALLQVPGREAEGRARLAEYRAKDEARRAKVSDERRRTQAASLAARAEVELREGRKGTARDLAARAIELDPTNELARTTAAAASAP